MANPSLNQTLLIINQQIESREVLSWLLAKADALICMALSNDFFDQPKIVMQDYLSALSDILESARQINEKAIKLLESRTF